MADDEELVARARRGDPEAFAALVRLHTSGLYAFVRARSPDAATAADLTQETFLQAWRAIGAFRGEAGFRTWLFRIAMNLANRESTRRRRMAPGPDLATLAEPDAGDRLEAESERSDVRRAVASLPPGDQDLVRFLYQDRLSYEEISDLSGLPLGTVKTRLHRARLRMREYLESLWEVNAP